MNCSKIIGARVYPADTESRSARDEMGHGTHTASTVVHGASLYGIAEGDVRGAVTSAKIAVYKVCSFFGCSYKDILAAFDDAIDDGVDLISLSLGPAPPGQFFEDPISIGSFHALANGINPHLKFFCVAPWILTVAATTFDRSIISKLALGNGKTFMSNVINTISSNKKKIPLTSGARARVPPCDIQSARSSELIFRACFYGCLDPNFEIGQRKDLAM
ncbi:hypothetical protein H6P81_001377 [Aristolochia fimbriata]|uniref:Peptidase S8/S53 domain-containing protein n=1 Tax=Aristolochia fimbriata TaxID=158543 RepID=A0AAV7F7E1_ARIFI|nr:hypothetical protein H6P81_001377 [Aristolochia fimbriata]